MYYSANWSQIAHINPFWGNTSSKSYASVFPKLADSKLTAGIGKTWNWLNNYSKIGSEYIRKKMPSNFTKYYKKVKDTHYTLIKEKGLKYSF